jgi:hypothetical protein
LLIPIFPFRVSFLFILDDFLLIVHTDADQSLAQQLQDEILAEELGMVASVVAVSLFLFTSFPLCTMQRSLEGCRTSMG